LTIGWVTFNTFGYPHNQLVSSAILAARLQDLLFFTGAVLALGFLREGRIIRQVARELSLSRNALRVLKQR